MVVEIENFPLFGQLDNADNPSGSCNVTSIAMCLHFYGIRGNGRGQLEDQINREMVRRGLSRHSPQDLETIANVYGQRLNPPIVDDFKSDADLDDIKKHLDAGRPTVVHGYFTSFGHIVCVTGYNDDTQQVRIHDPYGEWYASGYAKCEGGAVYWLSYRAFLRMCAPDGGIWTHFFSRGLR